MSLKDQRTDGTPLAVKSIAVPFSLFQRDYAGQNFVPLQEPWGYTEFYIKNYYPPERQRNALAYLQQAKSFYIAAAAADHHASPLLWYYCFMNLGKAYLVRSESIESLASAMHGIGDPADNAEGYVTLGSQKIKTNGTISTTGRYQLFPNLCRLLGAALPLGEQLLSIKFLLRRVVAVHRAYMKAFGEDSHFFKIREPQILDCPPPNGPHVWLRFLVRDEDFNDSVSFDAFSDNIKATFAAVTPGVLGTNHKSQCFESQHHTYTKAAIEDLPLLISSIRPKIHSLILPRGYFYYVLYEPEQPLPQIAVIYAIMFYLGSIVRYKPYDFDKLIEKKYRWVIDEFMQIAPKQFVILMVNQITQSEISYFEG